jgi:hypothetical protein
LHKGGAIKAGASGMFLLPFLKQNLEALCVMLYDACLRQLYKYWRERVENFVPLGEKDGSLGAIKRPGRRGSQHKGRSTLTDSEGLMHAKCPRFYFNAQHICRHFFLLVEL